MSNIADFKQSLERLSQLAQTTARLGLEVAKEQVETVVKNPAALNEQVEEVRQNLQTMAREMETKAQELVHMATTAMQQGPFAGGPARSKGAEAPTSEPPTHGESATAAGVGTAQNAHNVQGEGTPTSAGEAPKQ